MISKTMTILAIATAFVAGTIITGTMAYAAQGGQGDNLIVDAINALTQAIVDKDVSTDVTVESPNVEVNVPPADVQVEVVGVEGPQGPQGDKGDKGDKGDQGPQGPKGDPASIGGVFVVVESVSLAPGEDAQIRPTCNFDHRATGGGFGSGSNVNVFNSSPGPGQSWFVWGINEGTHTVTLSAYVVCLDP